MLRRFCLSLPFLLFSLSTYAIIAPGFWSTDCLNGLKKQQTYFAKRVLTEEIFYKDSVCSKPTFRFSTDGRVEFPSEDQTYIDFVYTSIYLTVFEESAAADFNKKEVCGLKTWIAAMPIEITGKSCAIFSSAPAKIPSAGDLRFGIYSVEEDRLYYGRLTQKNDGSSPATRPAILNRATEYIFQHSL